MPGHIVDTHVKPSLLELNGILWPGGRGEHCLAADIQSF